MSDEHGSGNAFFKSRSNVVLIAFGLIAGFFLVLEHRAHVFEWLPYLLLLACPLLHLFHGHGGHGGHGGGETPGESAEARKNKRPSDPASGSNDPGSEQHRHH
jgi:hypothetical protein